MGDIFDQISTSKSGGDIFDQIAPAKKKPLWQKAVQFLSGEHINYDPTPEPEVTFTPQGEMTKVVPETADVGLFNDPVTWAVGAALAPATPIIRAGNKYVQKAVNKAAGAGKEFIGQATGGTTDIAGLAAKKAIKKGGDIFDKLAKNAPTPKPKEAPEAAEAVGDVFDELATPEAAVKETIPEVPKIDAQQLKLARNTLPYYPARKPSEADLSILTEARNQGLLDPKESAIMDRIAGVKPTEEIKVGKVSSEPEIVQPEADLSVKPEIPINSEVPKAKSPQSGARNLIGRINELGGINPGTDYNSKLLRQDPDGKRIINMKSEKSADDIAAILNDEGWNVGMGDDLVELVKAGKGRTIYAPEKAEAMIDRQLDKEINAWADEQVEAMGFDNLIPQVKGGAIVPLQKYAAGSAINLNRLNTTQDVKQLINGMTRQVEERIGKRKVSWDETRARAEELGWNEETMRKAWNRKGAFSAAEIDAARQLNVNSIVNLHETIRTLPYDVKNFTPEIRAQVLDAIDNIRVTSQAASEAGRALNIHRRTLSNDPAFKEASEMNRALKALTGKNIKKTDALINSLRDVDFSDRAAVNKFIYNVTKTRWQKLSDGAFELWINGLLSNPLTHIRNITGNALTLAYTVPERAVAAGIDTAISKVTGRKREVFLREARGFQNGIMVGLRRFGETAKKGDKSTKFDYPPSALPGKIQKFLPTRALEAEDSFFKGFIEHQELSRLVTRKARQEGKTGKELTKRVAELLDAPPEALLEQAVKRGKYLTYQQELGEIGRLILRSREVVPGLKYFLPFVKTPANIAKFALERTPLNFPRLMKKTIKGELKGAELSEEYAKPIMGSLLAYTVYQLAENGYITGGNPRNKAEREEAANTGWQPYSIKLGDTYYSFGNLEPFGSILGMVADFSQIKKNMTEDEKFNAGAAIYGSISNNLKDKTFMVGVSNIVNLTADPARYGPTIAKNMVASAVPAVSGGIARATDPYVRDTPTTTDTIKSRIPVVSKTLPEKLTVWGDPMERQGSPASQMLSPMRISKEKGSPIEKEMMKFGLDIGYPSRKIRGAKMTPEEYWGMVKTSGSQAKELLNRMIASPKWEGLEDDLKQKVIKDTVEKFRDQAREEIMKGMVKDGRLKIKTTSWGKAKIEAQ